MIISKESYMKKKKPSDQEYHVNNLRYQMKEGRKLITIPDFPKEGFYDRDDGVGWWMLTKQFAIKSYVHHYLKILQRRKYIDTCFIDPLSSFGMIRLTKRGGKDDLVIPGTSLNAALVSLEKEKGFSAFYINDKNPEARRIISKRFEALNYVNNNNLNVNIEPFEEGKVDSNKWIINVLHDIIEKFKRPNYLMILDNQGMDIGYETIKEIKNLHEWGDIIITFHDSAFSRALHSEKKNNWFYGVDIKKDTTIPERRKIYIKQLKSIGFGRIEELFIKSYGNFFYTLLFCCRKEISAGWLNIIKYYRSKRYKYCTDQFHKQNYDYLNRRTTIMDEFLYKK